MPHKCGIYRILIVCSANKNRSAALAAYLSNFIKSKKIKNIKIDSVGTEKNLIIKFRNIKRTGALSEIRKILNRENVHEIDIHNVKPVSKRLIEESNLILAVSMKNKERILNEYPNSSGKVFTVKEFLGFRNDTDITDAHYHKGGKIMYDNYTKKGTKEAYIKMANELKVLALMILDKIEKLDVCNYGNTKSNTKNTNK